MKNVRILIASNRKADEPGEISKTRRGAQQRFRARAHYEISFIRNFRNSLSLSGREKSAARPRQNYSRTNNGSRERAAF